LRRTHPSEAKGEHLRRPHHIKLVGTLMPPRFNALRYAVTDRTYAAGGC
jgi:hypothetical protein